MHSSQQIVILVSFIFTVPIELLRLRVNNLQISLYRRIPKLHSTGQYLRVFESIFDNYLHIIAFVEFLDLLDLF